MPRSRYSLSCLILFLSFSISRIHATHVVRRWHPPVCRALIPVAHIFSILFESHRCPTQWIRCCFSNYPVCICVRKRVISRGARSRVIFAHERCPVTYNLNHLSPSRYRTTGITKSKSYCYYMYTYAGSQFIIGISRWTMSITNRDNRKKAKSLRDILKNNDFENKKIARRAKGRKKERR